MLFFSREEESSHGHHHHGHPLSPSGIPAGISSRSRGFLHAFASPGATWPVSPVPDSPAFAFTRRTPLHITATLGTVVAAFSLTEASHAESHESRQEPARSAGKTCRAACKDCARAAARENRTRAARAAREDRARTAPQAIARHALHAAALGTAASFRGRLNSLAQAVGVQWELPDVLACSVQRFRFASNHGAHTSTHSSAPR